MRRVVIIFFIALIFTYPAFCKDKKKKQVLPDAVLRAKTVAVIVDPDAGASIANPNEQVNARAAVENALRKWGRFSIVPTVGPDTDLVIEIRKASSSSTVIRGGGVNQRPPITIGGVGIGTPPVGAGAPAPSDGGPRMGNEVGPNLDFFTVRLSNGDSDSSGTIVWRYSGRNVLNAPAVRAVEEFKKVLTESEEAKRQNANP